MVEKIRQMSSSSCSSWVVNLSEVLGTLTNDVICRVAMGRKYSGSDGEGKKFRNIVKEYEELLGTWRLGDYVPWLAWTGRVGGLDLRVERVAKEFNEFLESVVEEHRERRKNGEVFGDGDGRNMDFVDILLEFQRDNKDGSSPLEDETIKALIQDMFAAGTGTTSTVLGWTIAELIRNPRTMKTLQNEVSEVLAGRKEEITEDDLEKMHYLKAVIKESLRLHTPAPLLVPRESTQDTKLMGYDIPAGTHIMINAWAIARDPLLWENPEEFHPEWFLDSIIDFRGLHFEFIPFGAGRRGCPGITFGVAVNELVLAKLVHNFEFSLPDGARAEELDMSEGTGITICRKRPLLVVTTSRTS